MGYTTTKHFDAIIQRHIRSGRASSKTEVVHQALTLLDAVTRRRGPDNSTFTTADELEAALLEAGPGLPRTPTRKARIYGRAKA